MTQDNSYHLHKLYIDNKPISFDISGGIKFSSNNSINTLNVRIESPDLQSLPLLNKSIKLYLNAGSIDSVPIFSGYITSVKPNEKNTSLTCHDPRILISGKQGMKLILSDFNNYDGHTLGAFLYNTITDKVNVDKTLIGIDLLTDTNPTLSMSKNRARNSIYDIAKTQIKKSVDDTDMNRPLGYFFDMVEGRDVSQLVIKKDKQLDKASFTFSFDDGLESYSYVKRTPINTYTYEGGTFIYTNTPTGKYIEEINIDKSRAEQRHAAIIQSQIEKAVNNEIQIKVNKCYNIGLGTIINLNVEEDVIRGNHRVVGKTISFGQSMTCSLSLNKKPIMVSEYLQ